MTTHSWNLLTVYKLLPGESQGQQSLVAAIYGVAQSRTQLKWFSSSSSSTFFGIAFLWDWNENCPFPVLWPLLSFPSLLAYWVQHLTASSFRIWNSSTAIPLPPLALFVVMLSKAHLTSRSRMSGSRWVITPSWLSWLWSFFLYSSSVYSCHLFLVSSASVRSLTFL